MSSKLVSVGAGSFMPALSVTEAVQRRFAIVKFVREAMKPGVDFGCIPGTPKPTLLKPGAEKLCTLFGLTTRFQIIASVEDWTGEQHGGEPFFYYLYRCQLWRETHLIAEGDGSCNSFEQKYRWRDAQRLCLHCGKNAIIKGKTEYGGGWLCFVKKGGCGAKFTDGDATIEAQTVGRIPNPDVADQVNTIQKMGQKRALIAATLLAVNASEFFTQDEEERISFGAEEISFLKPEEEKPVQNTSLAAEPVILEFAPEPAKTNMPPTPTNDASTLTSDMFLRSDASASSSDTPLVVVHFDVSDMETHTRERNTEQAPLPITPMTAAQARTLFESKAREQYGFTDRRSMALLAVALLGGKPERWTAEAWQDATSKPNAQWKAAISTLEEQRQAK